MMFTTLSVLSLICSYFLSFCPFRAFRVTYVASLAGVRRTGGEGSFIGVVVAAGFGKALFFSPCAIFVNKNDSKLVRLVTLLMKGPYLFYGA